MKQLLAISAIGTDRTSMVHDLTRTIADCGGSMSESRMIALGTEFAALMLVCGNWHSLARLETELKKLAETHSWILELKRTEERPPRTALLPYSVDVVCIDQPGIVSKVAGFFAPRGIEITELNTRAYTAAQTGALMFSMQVLINIPGKVQLAVLREDFMDFCEHLNLDAILEPVKN